MSGFRVNPDEFAAHTARLGSISPSIDTSRSQVGAGAGAAEGTSAHAGLSGSTAHVVSVLPAFGEAADRLHAALLAAGTRYASADNAIVNAAKTAPPPPGS